MAYRREQLAAPRLSGRALYAVSWLAGSNLGAGLRTKLLRDAGVLALFEYGCDEPPSFEPPLPVGEGPSPQLEAGGPEPIALAKIVHLPRPPLPDGSETISDFAESYERGLCTPVDVAERVIDATARSEALQPAMRAFIAQRADDVMQQARESHERLRSGQARSVLEGVPIAVKDELDQAPYPTTVGSRVHGRVAAVADATVVARLRAAGALLIGKTNMHEIGIGVTGLNPHHGTARNPFDPAHHTGGSSSGSAAAVAMGLCPAAVAADGGVIS